MAQMRIADVMTALLDKPAIQGSNLMQFKGTATVASKAVDEKKRRKSMLVMITGHQGRRVAIKVPRMQAAERRMRVAEYESYHI